MNTNIPSQLSGAMQYQLQVYFNGTQNIKPQRPVSFEVLEQKASEVMNPEAFGYIAGSADAETTTCNNKKAFNHLQIVPRMMRDVSQRSIAIKLFGMQLPTPVLLAPVGVL